MSQHDEHLEQLPDDVWDAVDDRDDPGGERVPGTDISGERMGDRDRSAEDAAIHVIRDAPVSSMYDPGESELELADPAADLAAPRRYFDDEEPEGGPRVVVEDDHTPDLEELLEVEHYAFASENEDEDEAGAGVGDEDEDED